MFLSNNDQYIYILCIVVWNLLSVYCPFSYDRFYISGKKIQILSLEQQYKDVMNVELCLSDVTLLLIVFGLV